MGTPNFGSNLAKQIDAQKMAGGMMAEHIKPPYKVTIRRMLAFVLDAATMRALGFLITLAFGKKLMFLGTDGWWIGVVIVAIYFSIFDSFIGSGKTLGKRIFGIEVVRVDGEYLNPLDAFLRYIPIGLMTVISEFTSYANNFSLIVSMLQVFSTFLLVAIVMFALFHPQRRSIHDLLMDTVVVKSGFEFSLPKVSLKKPVMAFAIAAFILGGSHAALSGFLIFHPKGKMMVTLWKVLEKRSDISNVRVTSTFSYDSEKKEFVNALKISAYVPKLMNITKPQQSDFIMRDMWKSVVMSGAVPDNVKQIEVRLWSGYDIGISHLTFYSSKTFPYSKNMKTGDKKLRYKSFPGKSKVN